MSWNIYFFETKRGERIVKEYIQTLRSETLGKISEKITLLKLYGPFLGMPYSKRITGKLYELRIRGVEEVRIFYTFSKGSIFLLHAFKKKSQKTPTKEIKTALARLIRLTKV